ncbi:hypothetical protein BHE74_00046634 [Ensete ventricosum]|nr:hypothetical protein BHE74_00046634 [Ensete ventricosum]
MVDFDRRLLILIVDGRLREKKEREEKGRYLLFPGSLCNPSPMGDSLPAGFFLPTQGERGNASSPRAGTRQHLVYLRGNEATPRLPAQEGRTRRRFISPFLFF